MLDAPRELGGEASRSAANIECPRASMRQLTQQQTVVKAVVVPINPTHAHIILHISNPLRRRPR
jgi:hypothetical protein